MPSSNPVLPGFAYYDYLEKVAQESPARAGFAFDGGRAMVPYLIDPNTVSLEQAITRMLGSCRATGNGDLTRELPAAHPRFKWLTCERISNIVGLGRGELVVDEEEMEAPPVVPAYFKYKVYRLDCEFVPRPWAVLSDDLVALTEVTWTNDTSSLARTDTVATEWTRWTDYDVIPQPETAYAQQGNLVLRVQGGAAPDGFTFSGFPRINLPKAIIRFRWYGVPFDYVDHANSHIINWIGRVNSQGFYGWPKGSLLYAGATVARRYTPAVPDRDTWIDGTYSTSKLCDIEFVWEYTSRTARGAPPTPSNANWVAAGWNLVPFIGSGASRGFYYATSPEPPNADGSAGTTDPTKWVPLFLSFPFELLFTDPSIYTP